MSERQAAAHVLFFNVGVVWLMRGCGLVQEAWPVPVWVWPVACVCVWWGGGGGSLVQEACTRLE